MGREHQDVRIVEDSQDLGSPLYRGLLTLRYILPITAFFLVVAHQFLAHTWLLSLPTYQHFLWQVLLYGTIGPILVWFALTWFAQWVRERDKAEAHLRCLYRVSRQAATATDMDALVEIALGMPEEILTSVAASLILREHTEAPWMLVGACHLEAGQREILESHLTAAGSDLRCGQCPSLDAMVQENCSLRSLLPYADLPPTATAVICLPLSTERPPLALLNVYLLKQEKLSPDTRRVLESMAAVLAVALDHARLRAREFQMLHQMEQVVRQQDCMTVALGHILADIAMAHRAKAGEVFLAWQGQGEPALIPVASWPEEKAHPRLIASARQALLGGNSVMSSGSPEKEYVIAIPLMAEGLTTGVLVLAGQYPFTASQATFLRVAAGMMALIIRNSQLYAELERRAVLEERSRLAREVHDGLAQSLGFLNFKMQQVDRLLDREQWKAARQALREMRESVQDLYAEVRLTIQDLRWLPDGGQGLSERLDQYVSAFAARTGLDISLSVDGELNLSPQEEIHLFRIAQEALANVHKHAKARRAWVRLRTGPDNIVLEVEDDGTGLSSAVYSKDVASPDTSEHFGLRIMQERAEALGGRLSLNSIPGQGTRLQVTVAASPTPPRAPEAGGWRLVAAPDPQPLAPGDQDW